MRSLLAILQTSIMMGVANVWLGRAASECWSMPKCIQCINPSTCSRCADPFVLANNSCSLSPQNSFMSTVPVSTSGASTSTNGDISRTAATAWSPGLVRYGSMGYAGGSSACILSWHNICIICNHGFEITTAGQCLPRFQQCLLYGDNYLCKMCHERFELANGQCLDNGCELTNNYHCTKCRKWHYINQYGHCINEGCTRMNNGKCIQCATGYDNTNGVCVMLDAGPSAAQNNINKSVQTNTTTLSTTAGKAANTLIQENNLTIATQTAFKDENCLKISANRCLKCRQGYYIADNGYCKQVPDNCIDQMCQYCKTGYISLNSKCVPLTNCIKIQNNICLVCEQGHSVTLLGSCIRSIDYCLEYSVSGCSRCAANYGLLDNSKCEFNSSYNDPNCNIKDFKGECVMCKDKFKLQPKYRNLCMSISNSQCKSTSKQGQCVSCYEGYSLNSISGECIQVTTIQNCAQQVQGECRTCANRYYRVNSTTCKQVDPLCNDYDKNLGYCLTCYNGYVLVGNICDIITHLVHSLQTVTQPITTIANTSLNASNCKIKDTNNPLKCHTCYDSYFNADGTCVKVNQLCKTYNQSNGNCLSCFEGYQLIDFVCNPQSPPQSAQPTWSTQHCKKTDGSNKVCLQCNDRFYLAGTGCKQVSALCNQYDKQTGACLTCYSGYVIASGECVVESVGAVQMCELYDPNSRQKCVKCAKGYYVKQNKCETVSLFCATYNETTGACLSCIDGYIKLKNDSCIVPALGNDPLCSAYDEQGYCLKCGVGHQLINSMCV